MKKAIPYIIILFLSLGALALLDHSCGKDKELTSWKAENAQLKSDTAAAEAMSRKKIDALEAEQATLRGMVDSANTIIVSKDATITTLKGAVSASNAATSVLRSEVQPVLDANPKVAALVASLDSGIALRDSIIAEQGGLILTLKDRVALGDAQYQNQVAISTEWQAMYDREHALRLNCEKGLALYDKRYRKSRLWSTVGKYGPPVAFVAGLLLSK